MTSLSNFLREFLFFSGAYLWFYIIMTISKILYKIVKNAYSAAKAEES